MNNNHRSDFNSLRMVLVCVLISGITSCRLISGAESTSNGAPRNAWLAEWLVNPVCQPPCFLGVTPGITTITETVKILSARSDIQITQGPAVTINAKYKELSWEFTTATQHDGSRMITDNEGDTILTFVVSPGNDQSLFLSEVILSYDTPQLVYLSDCREGKCVVQFIYMSSGMLIESFLSAEVDDNYKHSVEITPEISIGKIWFFPIGEEGYRKAFPFEANGLERSLEWNGYMVYKEK